MCSPIARVNPPQFRLGVGASRFNTILSRAMALSLKTIHFKHVLKGHKTLILNLAWSPDGKILATAGLDGLIRLWDMEENGKPAGMLEGYTNFALCLAWGPDNSLAAGTHQKTIDIWDIREKKIRTRLESHQDSVHTLSWSSDNRLLASGSYDGEVKIWNLTSPKPMKTLRVDDSYIQTTLFSPDGQMLAAGSRSGIIKLWAVKFFQLLETIDASSQGVYSLAWSGNGRWLASGCGQGDILLKDTASGESQIIRGHQGAVTGLSFHPGLKVLASKSKDHTVRIWDSNSVKCLHVFDVPHSGYNQANLGFHPCKPWLAYLSDGEKRTRIWELEFEGE